MKLNESIVEDAALTWYIAFNICSSGKVI